MKGNDRKTRTRMSRGERKKEMRRWGVHLLVVAVLIPVMFPFYWLAVSALQTPESILSVPPHLIPKSLSLHYIKEVFGRLGIGRFLYNSVYLSVVSTALTVALASLAAERRMFGSQTATTMMV